MGGRGKVDQKGRRMGSGNNTIFLCIDIKILPFAYPVFLKIR